MEVKIWKLKYSETAHNGLAKGSNGNQSGSGIGSWRLIGIYLAILAIIWIVERQH